jgi:hypothetical protein
MRALRNPRSLFVVAVVLALAIISLASGWSPAQGRSELRWAPVTLGLPLLVLLGVAEGLARLLASGVARGLATFGLCAGGTLAVFSAISAFLMPVASRDAQTWHLWPLFADLNMAVVAAPLFLLAAVADAATRLWPGRSRSDSPSE